MRFYYFLLFISGQVQRIKVVTSLHGTIGSDKTYKSDFHKPGLKNTTVFSVPDNFRVHTIFLPTGPDRRFKRFCCDWLPAPLKEVCLQVLIVLECSAISYFNWLMILRILFTCSTCEAILGFGVMKLFVFCFCLLVLCSN